jgi:hypothetical protein
MRPTAELGPIYHAQVECVNRPLFSAVAGQHMGSSTRC